MEQQATVQRVRERAYALWVSEGMIDGRDLDYWCAAEREVAVAESPKAPARKPATKARKIPRVGG